MKIDILGISELNGQEWVNLSQVIVISTPWRRKWQPTPVFLHGKPHGQRRLAGYSLWGHKELDTTE